MPQPTVSFLPGEGIGTDLVDPTATHPVILNHGTQFHCPICSWWGLKMLGSSSGLSFAMFAVDQSACLQRRGMGGGGWQPALRTAEYCAQNNIRAHEGVEAAAFPGAYALSEGLWCSTTAIFSCCTCNGIDVAAEKRETGGGGGQHTTRLHTGAERKGEAATANHAARPSTHHSKMPERHLACPVREVSLDSQATAGRLPESLPRHLLQALDTKVHPDRGTS